MRCGLRELIGNRISILALRPLLSFYPIRGVYAIVGLHARHLIHPGVLIAGLPVSVFQCPFIVGWSGNSPGFGFHYYISPNFIDPFSL